MSKGKATRSSTATSSTPAPPPTINNDILTGRLTENDWYVGRTWTERERERERERREREREKERERMKKREREAKGKRKEEKGKRWREREGAIKGMISDNNRRVEVTVGDRKRAERAVGPRSSSW